MDIPSKVWITCPTAELKQVPGTLIAASTLGFYEVNVAFGASTHQIFLPIANTALTVAEPIPATAPGFDLER